MPPLVEEVREVAAGALSSFRPGNLLDILIIAFIFYWLLLLLRGTTAMAVLRGAIALLLMAHILGSLLQLTTLNWLLRNSLPALLVVIFTGIILYDRARGGYKAEVLASGHG